MPRVDAVGVIAVMWRDDPVVSARRARPLGLPLSLVGALAGCGGADEDTRPARPDAAAEAPAAASAAPERRDAGGIIREQPTDVPLVSLDAPGTSVDVVEEADAPLPSCAPRRPLNPNGETTTGVLAGPSLVPTGCNGAGGALPTAGPEDVYSLTLTSARRVTLRTSDTTVDTVVSVRRACGGADTEVACNHAAPAPADGASLLRARLDPGTYHVVVDQFGPRPLVPGGPYTLSLVTAPVAANVTCDAATALASGVAVDGQAGSATESRPCGGGGSPSGLFLYYSVAVAAGQRATVVATPDAESSLQTFLLNTCADAVCRTFVESRAPGEAVTHVIDNNTAAPITRRVAVGAASEAARFTVAASLAPIPGYGVCASATPLADSATHNQVPFASGGAPSNGGCLPGVGGRALYYRVDVPVGSSFALTADPHGPEDVYVRLRSSCGAAACLDSSNAGVADREGVMFINTGAATAPLVVEVGNVADGAGSVDIVAQVAPSPRNVACDPAVAPVVLVPNGPTLTNQNSQLAPPSASCMMTGRQLYYQFTAAPRTRNVITAPIASGDTERVYLAAQRACSQPRCDAANAVVAGASGPLRLDNPTLDPVVYTVAARGTRPFGIYARTTPLAQPYTQTTAPTACVDLRAAAVAPSVRTLAGLDADDALSATLRLPFAFTLAGDTRSYAQVSSNGFMALLSSAADSLPDSYYEHGYLPDAAQPNGVIAPFWADLVASTMEASASSVRTGVSGTAPGRVFVVEWKDRAFYDYDHAGVRVTFQAQLYESSNNLEFHYCSIEATPALMQYATGGAATVGAENGDGTMGVLVAHDTSGAVSAARAYRLAFRAP